MVMGRTIGGRILRMLLLLCTVCTAVAADDGGVTGSFSVALADSAVTTQGVVDGQWVLTDDEESPYLGMICGEMAAEGFMLSFEWVLEKDGSSSGYWIVPGSDGYGGEFSVDLTTGIASFSGSVLYGSPPAAVEVAGTANLAFHGRPAQRYGGAMSGSFYGTGSIDMSGAFSRTGVGEITDGIGTGDWRVDIYEDGTMAGRMHCVFEGLGVYEVADLGTLSDVCSGELSAAFSMTDAGMMTFSGICSYKVPLGPGTSLESQLLPDYVEGCVPVVFEVPYDEITGYKATGNVPFVGTSSTDITGLGTMTVALDITSIFTFQLLVGDPSVAAATATNVALSDDTTEDVWYIIGELAAAETSSEKGVRARTREGAGVTGISLTAHTDVTTGSAANPLDRSSVLGKTVLPAAGAFSLAVPQSVEAVTLYAYADTDQNGYASEGDYGGVIGTDGTPTVVEKPLLGEYVEIGTFSLETYLPTLSGNVLVTADVLAAVPDARLVVTVSDESGEELECSVGSADALSFQVQVANGVEGQTLTVKALLDTNGNLSADEGEPSGTLTHILGASGTNGGLRIRVE